MKVAQMDREFDRLWEGGKFRLASDILRSCIKRLKRKAKNSKPRAKDWRRT